jgi:predicted transcriptional regulator
MINWYKIIKTNRGRSYIFYQKSINKMENKRLKLFLSIKEFAKLYKIPLRSYQRVIAKGQVGIKTASKIVKKILN